MKRLKMNKSHSVGSFSVRDQVPLPITLYISPLKLAPSKTEIIHYTHIYLYRNVDAVLKYINLAIVLSRFSTQEWKFHDSNVRSLLSSLSPEDQELFYFDLTQLQWQQYLADYMAGMRYFLLKEDTSTIPEARKRYKM